MAYPVFDLHCDTADRIGWATLDLDLRFTAGEITVGAGGKAQVEIERGPADSVGGVAV